MLPLKRFSTTGKHKVFVLRINISLWVFRGVCGWVGRLGSALGDGEQERRCVAGRGEGEIPPIY